MKIHDIIDKANKDYKKENPQENPCSVNSSKTNYNEVLKVVREDVSKNHSSMLAAMISSSDNKEKLLLCIRRCVTQKRLSVDGLDVTELCKKIYYDMAEFGVLTKYLYDDNVYEINLNTYNSIEIHTRDNVSGYELIDGYENPEQAIEMAKKLGRLGGLTLDDKKPKGDTELKNGVRISIKIAPNVDDADGAVFSIRKQNKSHFTKQQYIDWGVATEDMLDLLILLLENGVSVGFSGATNSGKTADIGVILNEMPNDIRMYVIEDTRELTLRKYDESGRVANRVVYVKNRLSDDPVRRITMLDNQKDSLRFSPAVIIPQEIRGAEALDVIESGRTGHTIATSLHANSAEDAYNRIKTMCQMAGGGRLEESLLHDIVSAIPIMVFKRKLKNGRRIIREIYEATGVCDNKVVGKPLFRYVIKDKVRGDDGRIKEIVSEFKQINTVSPKLAQRLWDNFVDLEVIRRFTGDNWKPEE